MCKVLEKKTDGSLYVTVITETELQQYQADGTFTIDDPNDDGKNATFANGKSVLRGSPKRKEEGKESAGRVPKKPKL